MSAVEIVAAVVTSVGLLFFLLGTIGILKFPDFYARMHAAGKCDTLGSLLTLVGLALLHGAHLGSVKILLIAVFIFLTSPTATHAVARAAHKNGVPVWQKKGSS